MPTLRDTLNQRISKDPEAFYKAVKAQNIGLSQSEDSSLRQGSLKAFSDQRLEDRFNTKILGALGINTKESSQQQKGRNYENFNKGSSSDKWNKSGKNNKSNKGDTSENW